MSSTIKTMDIYIRSYLWLHVFASLCDDEEEAYESISLLNKDSYKYRESLVDLVTRGLRGEYKFPSYMADNLSHLLKAINYLSDGDEKLERRLDDEIIKVSKERALEDIKSCLEDSLILKARGYISLER